MAGTSRRTRGRYPSYSAPYWSERAFVIDAQPGTEVTITARSANDVALAIVDAWGDTIAEADETEEDAESVTRRWTALRRFC